MLLGAGARLQRALIAWMLDLHVREHGYVESIHRRWSSAIASSAPATSEVRRQPLRDVEEDFWFVPTAEVPVTNLYRDEILDVADFRSSTFAYTPCFRREKMSAGRDVPRHQARSPIRQSRDG